MSQDDVTKQDRKNRLKQAELDQAIADAESAKLEAEKARIDLHVSKQNLLVAEAMPDYTGRFVFNESIDDKSVAMARLRLTSYSRRFPESDIELAVCSPGGEVPAGYHFYDTLRTLSAQGHHITTVVSGWAASMASVVVQAGDTRRMAAQSYLLIHEPSRGIAGSASQIRDEAEMLDMFTRQMIEILVTRSEGKATEDLIRSHINKSDWYVSAKEALEYGFIDEIGPA